MSPIVTVCAPPVSSASEFFSFFCPANPKPNTLNHQNLTDFPLPATIITLANKRPIDTQTNLWHYAEDPWSAIPLL
jgi:hypothetical protein